MRKVIIALLLSLLLLTSAPALAAEASDGAESLAFTWEHEGLTHTIEFALSADGLITSVSEDYLFDPALTGEQLDALQQNYMLPLKQDGQSIRAVWSSEELSRFDGLDA